MALKEGWKISASERDNIAGELTYMADYCLGASLPGGGIDRRDAGVLRARLISLANRVASVTTTEVDAEEGDGDKTTTPRKRPGAKGRGRAASGRGIDFSLDTFAHGARLPTPAPSAGGGRFFLGPPPADGDDIILSGPNWDAPLFGDNPRPAPAGRVWSGIWDTAPVDWNISAPVREPEDEGGE